jgi:predicted amidophosphoribosyltransferase
MEYSSLASIKGIGHIYANYLWRAFYENNLAPKIPPILSPSTHLLDVVLTHQAELKSALEHRLAERYSKKNPNPQSVKKKVEKHTKHIFSLIEKQTKGWLIDDQILTIATYCLAKQLLPKKEAVQLLNSKLEEEKVYF